MSECTTKDCANPTSEYLCTQCTSDLQQWLDKIPSLVDDLAVTVARLDKITKAGMGGSGGSKPGSKAPINQDASDVRSCLMAVTLDAKGHAKDPEAATIAENIIRWVKQAELLVLGPEEPTPRPREEIREEIAGHVEPMTAKDCAEYLTKLLGITFTSKRIRNWVERRGLDPVETDGHPKYRVEDVLAAYERSERRAALDIA